MKYTHTLTWRAFSGAWQRVCVFYTQYIYFLLFGMDKVVLSMEKVVLSMDKVVLSMERCMCQKKYSFAWGERKIFIDTFRRNIIGFGVLAEFG